MTFIAGNILRNPDLYTWRAEAGDAFMNGGFNNFKNAFNGKFTSSNATKAWDINQLRSEKKLLQPIHEKYLSDYKIFRKVSYNMTKIKELDIYGGVDILDYNSRIEFGCRGMGYTQAQGCTP